MPEQHEETDNSVESKGLKIPPWALWLLGAFIPWSIWITYTVMELRFTRPDGEAIVQKMEAGFDRLNVKFTELQREFDRNYGKTPPRP